MEVLGGGLHSVANGPSLRKRKRRRRRGAAVAKESEYVFNQFKVLVDVSGSVIRSRFP